MPYPESRSTPAARMSSAVCVMAVRIWALVYPGLTDLISAATAAAWGAAADVPKNGRKPGVLDDAPSAAVTSGLMSRAPPLVPNRTLLSVIGLPAGS